MKLVKKTIRNVELETYLKAKILGLKLNVCVGFLVTEGLKKILKENSVNY